MTRIAHLLTALVSLSLCVEALYVPSWEGYPYLSDGEYGNDDISPFSSSYGTTFSGFDRNKSPDDDHKHHKPSEQSSYQHEQHTPQEWQIYSAINVPTSPGTKVHKVSSSPEQLGPIFTHSEVPSISIPGLDLSTTIIHGPDFKLDTAHLTLWLASPSSSTLASTATSSRSTSSSSISSGIITSPSSNTPTTGTKSVPMTGVAGSSASPIGPTSSPSSITSSSSSSPTFSSSTSSVTATATKLGNASFKNLTPTTFLGRLSSVTGGVVLGVFLIL